MARIRSLVTPAATTTPIISLRGVLIALSGFIGALHLMVADTRGAEWSLEGVALAALGLIGFVLGLVLVRSRSIWPIAGTATLCTSVIVGIVVTRTSGYPFGPFRGIAAPFGAFEVFVLVSTALCLSICGAILALGADTIGEPGWRFDTLAPVAVLAAALPGLAVSSWIDDAAYLTGSAHVHGGTSIDSSNQHGFAYRAELSADERSRLGDQLVAARTAALSTPTVADARAAGWTAVGSFVIGAGQMMIDPDLRQSMTAFDPARPVALLFASDSDDAPIVAVQYEGWTSTTTPPAGFMGQDMFWHLHAGTCLVDDIRFAYDPPHVGSDCENVTGTRTSTISWMIRAWIVPGWENPNGTFAHDHPALR